jgi:hypothetical protein
MMPGAIFLSASVPNALVAPNYAATADSVAIGSAVAALLHVVLGRRVRVWGGHPAITPMIWAMAESMGLDYGHWVRLYQSDFFEDAFPDDNKRYRNVTITRQVDGDRERSLLAMREVMFHEHRFDGAVFIGGMQGILDEFYLFQSMQPWAKVVPLASTGGATKMLGKMTAPFADDLFEDLDYVAVLHRHLGIDVRERRFVRPDDQPVNVADRLWKKGDR